MRRALSLTVAGALCAALSAGPAVARKRINLRNIVNAPQQRLEAPANAFFNNRNRAISFGPGAQRKGPGAIHAAWDGRLTARAVQTAVDDGLLFIRSQQNPDGSIGRHSWVAGGSTALAALALLAAGAHPITDPELSRALAYLEALEPDNTYVRGIRANVWEYALRKVPSVDRWRTALKSDFDWLLAAVNESGWRYTQRSRDWDNSCTQYGVLGIWAAQRAGFEAPKAFWTKLSRHFLKVQNPDGGWGYTTGGSTANMATAGLASTFLVFDMLYGNTAYTADNPRTFADGPAAEVLASIERGMAWLGHQAGHSNTDSYYLYGIERTGVAGGRKNIGGKDWFREGAQTVLRMQAADGSMALNRGPVVGTALSTLFLVYGGAPVAFDKLQWGESQAWNLNPRDLSNVTKSLWAAYERPLNWHTVSIDEPVEAFEAPVLFISGADAWTPSEAEVARLRAYVTRGGTILAEPADRARPFAEAMARLAKRLFPEGTLRALPADHGVYTVLKQDWKDPTRPALRGLDHGGRTVFLLSDGYLGGDWQRNDLESDAFKLAMNVLFYATDRASMAGRFASSLPSAAAAEARGDLKVGVIGQGADPAASWAAAAPWLEHVTGLKVQATPVGASALGDYAVVHYSGRGEVSLSHGDALRLRSYVANGGTLVVDAWAGDAAFAEGAETLVRRLFGELAPLSATDPLALGQFVGGSDLAKGVRLKLPARRALRRAGKAARGQHLRVVSLGAGQVVFSAFDLAAALGEVSVYGAVGYTPEAARRIIGNVVAATREG